MHQLDTTKLVSLAVVLLIVGGLIVALAANREQQDVLLITNFEQCAAAGYPVMESYPEQCMTPDGRTFMRDISDESPRVGASGGCAPAGCSSQLCVEAADVADIITTCEYRAEYVCYGNVGRCERQASGECGWTDTPELRQCLASRLDGLIVETLAPPSSPPAALPTAPPAPGSRSGPPPATEY